VHRALVHLDDRNLKALGGTKEGLLPGLLYYIGPGALTIHAPVSSRDISFSIYVRHSGEWADTHHTKDLTTRKADLVRYFNQWHPRVRAMAEMLPDDLDKKPINTWALFDLAETPLPSYVRGTVAIAGDAAHATMPFYGHGAGMCVLDALILARLLSSAANVAAQSSVGTQMAVAGALRIYDSLLRPHTQFVVESSRLFAEHGPMGDRERSLPFNAASGLSISAEFKERMAIIAGFDVDHLMEQADQRFGHFVERSKSSGRS
jgi:salicylate hydroxylase